MKALTIFLKQALNLILLSVLITTFNPVMAKSDMQIMGDVQKAREMTRKHGDHSIHMPPVEESEKYRGVYYGYLPCENCAGIKMTLSLKNKRNYLMVTQYAQASNREYYDKGKYVWDDESRVLTLKSRKDSNVRKFSIINEGTIMPFAPNGKPRKIGQDEYELLRSDAVKSREVHIH